MTEVAARSAAGELPELAVLRVALESAPVGVGVCDSNGRVLMVNNSLTALLRRDQGQMLGRSFLEFVHPEELDEVRARYVRTQLVATTGEPAAEGDQGEVRCVTGDGETIWVHVTWSTTAPAADGSQYSIAHFTDLTRRRVVDDELVEIQQLLGIALEWSSVGILISDTAKRIRYVNRHVCDLLGYTEQDLRKMTFLDITHPDERGKTDSAYQQLLNGELDRHQTIKRYVRSDGKVLYCRRIALAARGRDGAARSTVAMLEPIGVVESAAATTPAEAFTPPCSSEPASPASRDSWWRSLLPAR